MKKLILVRHGSDDRLGALSKDGRQQVVALANNLKSIVTGACRVVSSGEDRAYSSAEILAATLAAELKEDGNLCPPTRYCLESAIEDGHDVETLIVVAHHDTANYLPEEIAKSWGRSWRLETPSNSNGFVFELGTKTVSRVFWER